MKNIMKKIKSLEDPGSLLKGVIGTIEDEAKEKTAGFLGMLLATLGASLLANLLSGKVLNGQKYLDKDRCSQLNVQLELVKAQLELMKLQLVMSSFLMPVHPLISFEIQNYYQNKT